MKCLKQPDYVNTSFKYFHRWCYDRLLMEVLFRSVGLLYRMSACVVELSSGSIWCVSVCVVWSQVQTASIRVCVKDVTHRSLIASSCAWTTARGTRSACSARCVSSFSPRAATPEIASSTASTTTNSKSWSFIHSSLQLRGASVWAFNNHNILKRGRVCLSKGNISKLIFLHCCFTFSPQKWFYA